MLIHQCAARRLVQICTSKIIVSATRRQFLRCGTRHIFTKVRRKFTGHYQQYPTMPVTMRSEAYVWSRLIAGIAGSNSAEGMDAGLFCSLSAVSVTASATGLSLVQRSPTECVCQIYLCSRSLMRSPKLELGCSATKNKLKVSSTQSVHIHVRFRFSAELLKIRLLSNTTPCWLAVYNKLPVYTTSSPTWL